MKKSLVILALMLGAAGQQARASDWAVAFTYSTNVLLDCRNQILAGVQPSSVTPTMVLADKALSKMEYAQGAQWGVRALAQQGFTETPAQAVTEAEGYLAQISAPYALTDAGRALAALKTLDLTPGVPTSDVQRILFDLEDAAYNLNQEDVLTVQDIARNDVSSVELAEGLWQGVDFLQQLTMGPIWGLLIGETGWPVPASKDLGGGIALDCTADPYVCAATTLVFPGVSADNNGFHGVPYYFRTEMDHFSYASMSPADAVATVRFHPRAWSDTDDAGYRLLMLERGVVLP